MRNITRTLRAYYRALWKRFGPQHWWPGETPFEVMVGAILTQNTSWVNVEKAIANLKMCEVLSAQKLYEMEEDTLATLIRSVGYFNVKARRLKTFIKWLVERYDGKVERLKQRSLMELREELLSIRGIGPETADSILLYALGKPSFVVDAYTYRVFSRHHLISEEANYEEIKAFFETALPLDKKNSSKSGALYNDFHAQLVQVGKTFCLKGKALCEQCPLKPYLPK